MTSKLANINMVSLRDAIESGCRTMCSVFNADDHNIPFFSSMVFPCASLGFSSHHSESHVPGRHLNALLTAQDVLGIKVDEECIKKHTDAAFFSYSGLVPFPLNRESLSGPLNRLVIHNVREGFHALYVLVKYRGSTQARELAERSIAAVRKYWHPDSDWDSVWLGGLGLHVNTGNFISGIGRAIGPLVKYYRATGYTPALELALALKEKAINTYFTPLGDYDPVRFGTHIHSVTCVMSSLAQLADLMRDMQLMERVRVFYDNGLWKVRDELGWAIESYDPSRNPDRGEANSTGDIVETALLLGKWGYTRCFQDAERILRGHLLPSQLRDISFIRDTENLKGQDGLNDIANRHLGAFGFPAPYGHLPVEQTNIGFNMDIVGGAVGSLCEAYRYASAFADGIHWVNLLFDHETENISVQSPYTHDSLTVIIKRAGGLFVRIPPWVDRSKIIFSGAESSGFYNGYILFTQPKIQQPITLHFPLTEQELLLRHRTRDIRTRLRGDCVIAMDNFGMNYSFFDPYE